MLFSSMAQAWKCSLLLKHDGSSIKRIRYSCIHYGYVVLHPSIKTVNNIARPHRMMDVCSTRYYVFLEYAKEFLRTGRSIPT